MKVGDLMTKRKTDTYESELKEFRTLAKRADQRLREIERYADRSGFENMTNWAYKKAMRDIQYWSGEGKTTFNRDAPTSLKQLRAKTRDIQEFLNAPTSTMTGTKEMYQNRADILNKRYGTSFSWEDLGDVFDRKEENEFYQKFGGKTYLKAVDYLKNNEEKIMKGLMSRENITIRTGNRKVNTAVNQLLDEYGIQFGELF